jgi:uncharacterized protein DUF547
MRVGNDGMMWLRGAALLWTLSAAASGGVPDAAPFDAILAERARGGGFDYAGVTGQDKKRLAAYLANLGDADTREMTSEERTAFLINAYNAWAIETLLENPGKKITEVDGAFNKASHRVGREMLTLDQIEGRLRDTEDARIHFAIVCVSKSCPPLRNKAYTAAGLSDALDAQGRAFVGDATKNVIDRASGRVALSMIFAWNRKEFERDGTLLRYVSRLVGDPATARWLAARTQAPDFLPYDWSPNQP